MAAIANNSSVSVPEVKTMTAEVKRTLRKAWGNEDGANRFWLEGIAGYLSGIAVDGVIPSNFHPERRASVVGRGYLRYSRRSC